ncbi:MAG: hypothetical protein CBC13_04150 [Planctomycetia bacterium TMED53]|nr:MAG: hypothetical protein CBC13_04150 [Planctomycetia bacterium TMED53]
MRKETKWKPPGSLETLLNQAPFSSSGFDLNQSSPGQILESPHEITVEDHWRNQWASIFPASQRIHTSIEYANSCGFPEIPVPADLLLNMALSFSLDPLSDYCRYQLDIENARQEALVQVGDTLKSYSRVEEVRNTSRGDASVVSMTHILVNQREERVFTLLMRYYFDPVEVEPKALQSEEPHPAIHHFQRAAEFSSARFSKVSQFPVAPHSPLRTGDLIFHRGSRPIAWSENLSISTLLQESHPIHWDTHRYGREGLIISGGLIHSLVSAISNRDFRQVIDEVVLHCSHLQPVSPGDQVGAISRILSAEPIDSRLEAVRVKTLGLKNFSSIKNLEDRFPSRLLKEKQRSRREIDEICTQESPQLNGKIVLQSVRTLIRPRMNSDLKTQSPD